MSENRVYAYEAMFLLGQAQAADLAGAVAHINEIMARGHAEILGMRKWDERRLAYEIRGQKRGTYILVYFKAPGKDVAHIERDCNLSEKIMRTLIVRADQYTPEEIASFDGRKELEVEIKLRGERAAQPATEGAAPAAAAAAPASEPAPQ